MYVVERLIVLRGGAKLCLYTWNVPKKATVLWFFKLPSIMSAYLICQTTSGIPLFTRRKGDIPPLPFPVSASLNGVFTFATSHGSRLMTTTTADCQLVWKEFLDSLILVVVASDDGLTSTHLVRLLERVFQSMVFCLGWDDLANIRSVERLKRELKASYPLIDKLLDSLQPEETWDHFCDLTDSVDCLFCPEKATFEGILQCFTESVGTVFGCLVTNGKVAAATADWWSLTSEELVLIFLCLTCSANCTGRDIPIYLPIRSPKVPFRLVTWKLTQLTDIAVLCGPTPSLAELEREVKRFWRPAFALIKSAETIYPVNIPPDFVLDKNILGYVLIHTQKRRCVSSLTPHIWEKEPHTTTGLSSARRRDILRSFYKTVLGTVDSLADSFPAAASSVITETFMTFEYHTCHALVSKPFLLLVLYPAGLHNHILRSVSQKLLQTLSKEKNLKW